MRYEALRHFTLGDKLTYGRIAAVAGVAFLAAMSFVTVRRTAADDTACGTGPAATGAELRSALFSVYFHSYYEDGSWLPVEFQPIPLIEASRIICRDVGAAAESRRRRSIAKLASAGLAEPRHSALVALGAPIGQIQSAFDAASLNPGTPAATPPPTPGVPLDQAAREQIVYQVLGNLPPAFVDCERTPATVDVNPDYSTGRTTVTVEMSVKRPLSALRVVMDPQHWDDCSKPYFAAAHVAQTGAKPDALGDVPASTAPPTPGSSWVSPLFEHFELNWKPLSYTSYKNLLDIDSTLGGASPRFDFKLKQPTYGQLCMLGVCRKPPVEYDSGSGTATPAIGGWVKLTANKTISFSNLYPFNTAFQLVTAISLHAMGDSINEGACCAP